MKEEYPYLQALDEMITDRFTAGYVDIGLIEAPAEMIVGTVTAGRRDAFAANFMPLLPAESEFGAKWIALYYEFMEFYRLSKLYRQRSTRRNKSSTLLIF